MDPSRRVEFALRLSEASFCDAFCSDLCASVSQLVEEIFCWRRPYYWHPLPRSGPFYEKQVKFLSLKKYLSHRWAVTASFMVYLLTNVLILAYTQWFAIIKVSPLTTVLLNTCTQA